MMEPNKIETFQQFITNQNIDVSMPGFIGNLFVAAALSYLLGVIYTRYARSLSNRREFAHNFMLVTLTTFLVISIVKSSLALSLGLVGALSIVRFRAAIKEPEELSYLFLAIGIGLGFGANQGLVTGIAFALISVIICIRNSRSTAKDNQNLFLTVSSHNPRKADLEQIVKTLKSYCTAVDLKRFDETKELLEVSFLVEFCDLQSLQNANLALKGLGDSMKVTFLDNKGILT